MTALTADCGNIGCGVVRDRLEKAEAEVLRLRTELGDAIQFAAEGWSYASPYFQEKWGYGEQVAEFASAILTPRPKDDAS